MCVIAWQFWLLAGVQHTTLSYQSIMTKLLQLCNAIHIVQEAKPMLPLADLLEGPPATGTGWSYIFETFLGNLTRIMRLHRTTALSTIACDANRAEHLAPCSV